jgi:hypothetical protein
MKKKKPWKRREWQRRQIKRLTDEIKKCMDAGLWYATLVLTLILPDIFAALESHDGKAHKYLYEKWCEKWLPNEYAPLAQDLYFLRCAIAHQGRFRHEAIVRRVFVTLGSNDDHMREYKDVFEHKDALTLDLKTFAKNMIDAVDAWYLKEARNQNVQKHLGSLVQHYPRGSLDFLDRDAIG